MTREIPLTRGHVVLVDDEDYENVSQYKWCASKARNTTYAVRGVTGKNGYTTQAMHRYLMNEPANLEVDHKDGNGLNNTRENIRCATHGQNMMNQRISKANTTGFKGVRLVKVTGRYQARIKYQKKEVSLGTYATAEEAHIAYTKACESYHGEFANIGESV